jgi:phosphoenolpyruvate carboxykinase (ATP)
MNHQSEEVSMAGSTDERTRASLAAIGIRDVGRIHRNLPVATLFEEAVRRGEGLTSEHGALVVKTGEHTGRAAKDKY